LFATSVIQSACTKSNNAVHIYTIANIIAIFLMVTTR
jgi:hypothetical protein